MPQPTIPTAPAPSPLAEDYERLARGEHADGPRGTVRFAVSTDDPAEGKGDLFVALGLARALRAEGWGVAMWPTTRWAEAAGWQLVWELPVDYAVSARTEIKGNFTTAVETVAASMATADTPMKAIFYEGNRVLRIVAR